MLCDMCGKETNLFTTFIEGTKLNVCKNCAKYGKILGPAKTKAQKQEAINRIIEEATQTPSVQMVLPSAPTILKQKRESLGLTQEQFAKKINEKTSFIQSIEKGRVPNMNFARKLEKILNMSLVKDYTESHKQIKVETKEVTIGSMIKFKVRKKK